ncbi:MAG: hypothetical protein NVSMB47_04560 [Polyangiales bacterium]
MASMKAVLAALLVSLPGLAACAVAADDPSLDAERSPESARHHVESVYTISYAPNSYVIGNAYPGWTDDVQGAVQWSSGPGNPPPGHPYRWGFIYGPSFDRCAWISNGVLTPGPGAHEGNRCGAPQQIDTPHFLATYTNGIHNRKAGDGSATRMNHGGAGCTDVHGYGNVDPWKIPATPYDSTGVVTDGSALYWRYVTRDGNWVLVHDPAHNGSATVPNWYFVHRGCVSVDNLD